MCVYVLHGSIFLLLLYIKECLFIYLFFVCLLRNQGQKKKKKNGLKCLKILSKITVAKLLPHRIFGSVLIQYIGCVSIAHIGWGRQLERSSIEVAYNTYDAGRTTAANCGDRVQTAVCNAWQGICVAWTTPGKSEFRHVGSLSLYIYRESYGSTHSMYRGCCALYLS